jgi:hypothetical protein
MEGVALPRTDHDAEPLIVGVVDCETRTLGEEGESVAQADTTELLVLARDPVNKLESELEPLLLAVTVALIDQEAQDEYDGDGDQLSNGDAVTVVEARAELDGEALLLTDLESKGDADE